MAEAAAAPQSYLVFGVHDRHYALPAADVAEIIATPAVARLPHSPRALLGMANLRGAAVAVASAAVLLDPAPPEAALLDQLPPEAVLLEQVPPEAALPDRAPPGSAGRRAIVLRGAAPVVLTIDAIEALIAPAAAQCQAGMLQRPGAAPAKILDIFSLLEAAFHVAPLVEALPDEPVPQPAHGQNARPVLLLRFDAAQPYALPLDEVSEIAPVPGGIIAVAQAEAVVLGIAAWRERVLTVFSLRALLGWPPVALTGGARMIILRVAGRNLGLVVDGVRDIVAVPPERLEPVPGLLAARLRGQSRLQSIFRGEGGQLLAVLSAATLLGDEMMQQLGKAEQQDARPPAPRGPTSRYVVFSLGEEEFGLDVSMVDEVAAAPQALTRLPRMPKFLRGVVNLRGEALPVIDQRARFGLPPLADAARAQRLIVVRGAKNRAGLLVDAVTEVLSVADASVAPAPKIPGEAGGLVRGVVNLPAARRMILLLDGAALLSSSEAALLAAFAARAGASAA